MFVASVAHAAVLEVRRHIFASVIAIFLGAMYTALVLATPPGFHDPDVALCVSTARGACIEVDARKNAVMRGWSGTSCLHRTPVTFITDGMNQSKNMALNSIAAHCATKSMTSQICLIAKLFKRINDSEEVREVHKCNSISS
jgi:hypothetical protein